MTCFSDNRRAPYNHRQKLFKNGTLMISFVDKQDDVGDYQCTVKGGHEAEVNKATGRRKVQVQSKSYCSLLTVNVSDDALFSFRSAGY